jgi:hypothetical protein
MTTDLPEYQRARCLVCGVVCEQHRRLVQFPDGARCAALDCRECEMVYFVATKPAAAPTAEKAQP